MLLIGLTISCSYVQQQQALSLRRAHSLQACTYEALRLPPPDPNLASAELAVDVKPAGDVGFGAFAAEAAPAGTYVGQYVGEPVTLLQTTQRYTESDPAYLFQITPDLYLDAQDSDHFSRFFNHAELGTLNFTIDTSNRRVSFFLSRDVAVGDEYAGQHRYSPASTPSL